MNSAQQLHRRIKHLHRHGNRVRSELIAALRVLHEEQTYQELGYSSFPQYCERELGVSKSTAYEWLSTGIRLDHLPGIRALHAEGDLSWEQTREIAKVATAETEREWTQFAIDHSNRELRAEVKDAQESRRDRPRSREHGLPNVRTKVVLELTRDERERFETMLRIVREGAESPDEDEERGPGTSGAPLKDSLMLLVDRFLAGGLESAAADSNHVNSDNTTSRTRQAVVYQHCPECLESPVHTAEGPVRVDASRIEELADVAERVEIHPDETLEMAPLDEGTDAPNTAHLVRKVLHRDGMRCCNPGCGSRHQLHSHHVVFRSMGGRTILANEITLCSRCHALVHAGLLEVTGSAQRGAADLVWTPACQRGRDRARELDDVWRELRATSVESAAADSGRSAEFADRHLNEALGHRPVPRVRAADSRDDRRASEHDELGLDLDDLIRALVKLGYDKDVAERDLRRAIDALRSTGSAPTEEAILRQVFTSKRARNRRG